MNELTLETVRAAVGGNAAAFRRVAEYQPPAGLETRSFRRPTRGENTLWRPG